MNSLLDNQQVRKRRRPGSYSTGSGEISRERNSFRRNSSRKQESSAAFRPSGIASFLEQNDTFIDRIQRETARNSRRVSSRRISPQSPRRARTQAGESRALFTSFRDIKEGFKQGAWNLARFFTPNDEDIAVNYSPRPAEKRPERRAVERERFEQKALKKNRARSVAGKRRGPSFSVSPVPVAAILIVALGIFFAALRSGASLDWLGREVVDTGKDQGSQYNLARYAGISSVENTTGVLENAGEAIPLDLMETFAWQSYTVKKGDSVSKIAAVYSVSMDAIIASNDITNARSLREGEKLRIPNMDGIPYKVKNGDSLSGISRSMGVPLEAILDANDIQSDIITANMSLFIPGARMKREDLKLALGELFVYPVSGARLSSPFGWRNDPISGARRHHAALDLAAPQGTPIKAAMDGRVSALGYNNIYGNFIILDHPGGYQSMYAHLFSSSVKKGAQISQGTLIGTVGNTGYSTGPHLHFAIFKNDRAVNPLDFLNPRK